MDEAARQLLRALRGPRSQVAFSRRLGYRGNVAAKWEGGHRFPTFGETLRAALRTGVDVPEVLAAFHASSAGEWSPDEPERIDAWLSALRARTPQALLAERAGLSRQQVGRLLSGRARGRLPQVLALVDALTGRLPDLVRGLVPIEQVPALVRQARVRSALARLAFAHPWSPAAQAWLGGQGAVPLAEAPRRLAESLELEEVHCAELVDALIDAQAAAVDGDMLVPGPPATVEIEASREDVQALRAHWAAVSAARVRGPGPDDLFSFNVFAVSREDLVRIKEAQRRFYREVRAIVADSPPEVTALLVAHTTAWTGS